MRYIWRLDGVAEPGEAWTQGLLRHLAHQPVTVVQAVAGAALRVYVAVDGCARCGDEGCAVICHRMLLLQLVRATQPRLSLAPVPEQLAPRPLQRLVTAAPTRKAQPLDAAWLAERWADARLMSTWSVAATGRRQGPRHLLQCAATLAIGAESAPRDVAAELGARGWGVAQGRLPSRAARMPALPPLQGPRRPATQLLDGLLASLCPPAATEADR